MKKEQIENISSLIQDNVYNFSIDYLEVYGEFDRVRDIAIGLNSENSDYKHYEWFDVYYESQIKNYEYKLTFSKDGVNCFWVYRWVRINDYVETKDYICVYWNAFLVLGKDFILKFIEEKVKIQKIKRFDLCIDISLPIEGILSQFKKIKQTWSKFFWSGWKIETVYIWQKKRKNKQSIIRIYNKIADIYVKWKQKFLSDYLLKEHMTRIEIEFREEISCNVPFEDLYNEKFLIDTFYSYIQKHTIMFQNMDYERVVLKRFKKNSDGLPDPESVWAIHLVPPRHRRTFMWYAKSILKMWACPVDILLRNDLVSDTTLRDITLCVKDNTLDLEYYRIWGTLRNAKQVFGSDDPRDDDTPF